jgi:hypothetical protein
MIRYDLGDLGLFGENRASVVHKIGLATTRTRGLSLLYPAAEHLTLHSVYIIDQNLEHHTCNDWNSLQNGDMGIL